VQILAEAQWPLKKLAVRIKKHARPYFLRVLDNFKRSLKELSLIIEGGGTRDYYSEEFYFRDVNAGRKSLTALKVNRLTVRCREVDEDFWLMFQDRFPQLENLCYEQQTDDYKKCPAECPQLFLFEVFPKLKRIVWTAYKNRYGDEKETNKYYRKNQPVKKQ